MNNEFDKWLNEWMDENSEVSSITVKETEYTVF